MPTTMALSLSTYFDLVTNLAFLGGEGILNASYPAILIRPRGVDGVQLSTQTDWWEVADHLEVMGFLYKINLELPKKTHHKVYLLHLTGLTGFLLVLAADFFKWMLKRHLSGYLPNRNNVTFLRESKPK